MGQRWITLRAIASGPILVWLALQITNSTNRFTS